MKVLSLFDGMSCGQIALSKLGVKVDKYYASEIDKYAIQITQKNFPNTIQLGDVCNLDPKDFMDVDLILAGSPCQGFSFAGKQLAFDDPRSALFFEFIRLLKEIKPKYFLLENVRMKKEFLEVITEQVSACYTADDVAPEYKDIFGSVKLEPHFINSSLLSAQSRQRYYWTNIPNIKQPQDKGIILRDILETDADTYLSEEAIAYMNRNSNKWSGGKTRKDVYIKHESEKGMCLTANMHKGVPYGVISVDKPNQVHKTAPNTERAKRNRRNTNEKSFSLTATMYKGAQANGMTLVPHKPNQINPSKKASGKQPYIQDRVFHEEGKSHALTAEFASRTNVATKPKQVGVAVDVNGHDILKRVYHPDGKSPTLNAHGGGNTEPKVVTGGAMRGRAYDKKGKRMDKDGVSVAEKTKQMLELRKDEKSNAITTVGKDSLVVEKSKIREKSKTVRSGGRGSYDRHEWDSVDELHWRKLTPLECERLQTVPDGYTEGVSNTQRYRMLGNGWTVDVIAHILTNMEK